MILIESKQELSCTFGKKHRYFTLLDIQSWVRFCWHEFGEFPRLVGRYCSYLQPKQAGGTPQILVNKTSPMTGHLRVYWKDLACVNLGYWLYRASHVLVDLRWVDLDLASSPCWWAATVATYCPSRVVEHPESKLTKPSLRGHGTPCTYYRRFQWTPLRGFRTSQFQKCLINSRDPNFPSIWWNFIAILLSWNISRIPPWKQGCQKGSQPVAVQYLIGEFSDGLFCGSFHVNTIQTQGR